MIVVGNGLIGSHFRGLQAPEEHVIFASGVSNSASVSIDDFKREEILLKEWLVKSNTLIYFSTCSIEDPARTKTPYVQHKLAMEGLVMRTKSNIVIRVPQIVGKSTNKHTLVNFLVEKINQHDHFTLHKGAIRNLIDIDDLVSLTMLLIRENRPSGLYSFAMPHEYEVSRIVSCIEERLNLKGIYSVENATGYSYAQSQFVEYAINQGVIRCGEDYLESIISKYF